MNLIKFVLNYIRNHLMFINVILYKSNFIYLFKTARITFLSYILFDLLDVEHGSPISHKNVCYGFQILHYISHKMKSVSSLRVAALACNITLRTLPVK